MPLPLRAEIVGHRGAAGLAPENTLAGFLHAARLGIRAIELDVRLTRDEIPVCLHDERLDRVTRETGPVSRWSWTELSRIPVLPGAFGGAFPGGLIPSLEEAVHALPADCRFLVELKPERERPDLLVRRALEVLAAAGAMERCRIISFEQDLLRRVREAGPAPLPLALGVLAGARERDRLHSRAREVGAVALHLPYQSIDPDLVEDAREKGLFVNAWTVNQAEEVRRFIRMGVEEITTDYPDRAMAAIVPAGESGPFAA